MATELSVLVPFRSDEPHRLRAWEWLRRRWAAADCELVVEAEGDGDEGDFSHAGGINRAAERATGDVFLVIEADVAVDLGWVRSAAQIVANDARTWLLPQRYDQLTPAATQSVLARDPTAPLPAGYETSWSGDEVSWCGGIMLSRAAFEHVGGYDERFGGWGSDDICFAFSLIALWGPQRRLAGASAHLWHPRGQLDAQPAAQHELTQRYLAADGDAEAMRALIAER